MAARQIKDAKDLSTNELIYFKGHAQATYMSDGTTVEDAINSIQVGSGGDSDANVQAVDTEDVVDDVNVEYATTAYVNGLVGDINSVLESIISGGSSVQLITFKVGTVEYQSEEGMTWEQWINSEYNIEGFTVDGEQIRLDSVTYIATISSSDVIIPNYAYVIVTSGSSGGA